MKETGVIRRIDELGRIVIPKEVRKKLKIRNGDSIDIYIDQEKIVLEKYSALKDLDTIIKVLLETLKKVYNAKIVITDMSKIIATTINQVAIHDNITEEYITIIEKMQTQDLNQTNIKLNDSYTIDTYSKIKPIIIYGDLFGSILIMDCNNKSVELLDVINSFISDYLES
ncbi:MAG: AbrB/MazE/SpoVT family DNA-binding domain-containing protein [bacterium]